MIHIKDKNHPEYEHHQPLISNGVEVHERDKFNNQFEYLLSVLGFAAGFGSLWRFPYLIFKNGGGVFLIPYMILFFLVGIPSFYFETALGQVYQKGPPQIFQKIHNKWKGIGILPVINTAIMATYYNLILAYSIYYLWESFKFPLPWQQDEHQKHTEPWNKEYFYKEILNSSGTIHNLGGVVWPLFFCYAISQGIVFLCIQKGVSVSGKIALVTATSPYILLFILFLRGLFLEGASLGISYLFKPDWSKVFSPQVWVDAANQVIFQISTGCATLVFFGSYRPQNQEIKNSSLIIPLLTILCGFLSSFVVFSYMGYMSHLTGIKINDIPLAGPDLAFVVFPSVLNMMPFSNLWAIIFFLVMIFLGIDTQFAFMDCLAAFVDDEIENGILYIKGKKITMRGVRAILCTLVTLSAFLYCTQGGFYYLGFIDHYGVGINLIVAVFIESAFFTWYLKWDQIEEQIQQFIHDKTPEIITKLIQYTVPGITLVLSVFAIFLQLGNTWKHGFFLGIFGWLLTLAPYIPIYYYYTKYK